MTSILETIADNVWSVPAPFKVFGLIALNGRMTIVRLQNGDLWLHSPIPISDALREELDALGPVRYLVAPSCFHHMFVGPWKEAYPDAQIFAARGLHKKREDLSIDTLFREPKKQHWDEFSQFTIEGMPAVNEVLFFHKPSSTLIVTDFLFYIPEASGFTGFYAWINGFKQKITTPFLFTLAIKDKEAFRTSLTTLRSWNVKHISMCHHYIYSQEDANTRVQAALDALNVAES